MPTKKTLPANALNTVLSKAKNTQVGPDIYSNLQRVVITQNELFIDFYAMTPDLVNSEHPQVNHLQRVILPLMVAKDFSRILSNIAGNIEISDIESTESAPNTSGKL